MNEMSQPCDQIGTLMKHGEDIARGEQATAELVRVMNKIANDVEVISERMSTMKGFIAGSAAVGGGIVAIVVFMVKTLPAVLAAVLK